MGLKIKVLVVQAFRILIDNCLSYQTIINWNGSDQFPLKKNSINHLCFEQFIGNKKQILM